MASKPTPSSKPRTNGTDRAKGGPPVRSPMGKMHVKRVPPGASNDFVCVAHSSRTDGSSAHKNVQSHIKSYCWSDSEKKSAQRTSTLAASGAFESANSCRAASHAALEQSTATTEEKPCCARARASYARPQPGTKAVIPDRLANDDLASSAASGRLTPATSKRVPFASPALQSLSQCGLMPACDGPNLNADVLAILNRKAMTSLWFSICS
mmetsp:Transcript_43888/g.78918  ORF Transcript_43888/g.78918 Transcript_43888/m.78918 type:complete len:210 (-) Transcript_43888:5-634(-)